MDDIKSNISECAVLIVSCDKNKGVLDIFFDFFNRNWSDCPFEVYLGVENSNFEYDNVYILNSHNESFAGRLKEYISKINRKYIMIILDDFILENKINNTDLLYYYNIISSDESIANISLRWIDEKSEKIYEKILKKEKNTNNLLNLQVAFWNANILSELLRNGENPWQTELFGSVRARQYSEYAFCNIEKDVDMPFKYNGGWLIVKGAWNGNEIKRLHLESYATSFLDGKKILYEDFGRMPKYRSVPLRLGMIFRKFFSNFRIYF